MFQATQTSDNTQGETQQDQTRKGKLNKTRHPKETYQSEISQEALEIFW